MPSQQLQSLIAMVRARPIDRDAGVQEMRAGFERIAELFPTPQEVAVDAVSASGVPAEWIAPPGVDPLAALLFLHGGGYTIGSLNTHRHLVADLARAAGVRGLSAAYRLAPEHPFPAAVEDALTVYRWLLSTGIEPARIVAAGDSAGGGLMLAMLVALRDAGDPLPAAGVALSPWTDLAVTGASVAHNADIDPLLLPRELYRYAERYLGPADPHTPLASPLYADLHGLPPLLIHVGTAEILLDDAVRFAERVRNAGVDVTIQIKEDLIHVWHFFAQVLPEGEESIREIGQYVNTRIG